MDRVTLESLLCPDRASRIGEGLWYFCDAPTCDIVYFTEEGETFAKSDLTVRVGLKERHAPRPVCYCFDHTEESLLAEVRETGRSTAIDSITAKIKAGECSCEILNPKGACCLGDVRKLVKKAIGASAASHARHEDDSDCCSGSGSDER